VCAEQVQSHVLSVCAEQVQSRVLFSCFLCQASVAFKLINTVVNRATWTVTCQQRSCLKKKRACGLHFMLALINRFFNAYSYFILDLGFVCFARMSLVMHHYC
jgi:hypothetical protein